MKESTMVHGVSKARVSADSNCPFAELRRPNSYKTCRRLSRYLAVRTSTSLGEVNARLMNSERKGELSVEMWLTPHDLTANGGRELLFTLGKADYPSSDPGHWFQSCSTDVSGRGYYDLLVTQKRDKIYFAWAAETSDEHVGWEDDYSCKGNDGGILRVTLDDTSSIHVVYTLKDREQKVYVNAVNAVNDHRTNAEEKFDTRFIEASSHLDFFTNEYLHNNPDEGNSGYLPWPGQLHLFAMYDKILTPQEVSRNFAAKLPNGLPTLTSATITTNEDGEEVAGSHYDNPAWYQREAPIEELMTISLDDIITDADVHNPSFPNFNATGPKPKMFLATLPSSGTLFLSDNTPVTAEGTHIKDEKIKYRPERDIYGESIATFSIYAADGLTGKRNLPGSDAEISISVRAVDDPPVPVGASNASVLAGVDRSSIFSLEGTDVDNNISGAVITSFPENGDIHHILSDGVTFGTKIDESTDSRRLTTLKVGYRFKGSDSSPDERGFLAEDTISFKLVDASNVTGVAASLSFEVSCRVGGVA